MFDLGIQELIVIFVVALLVFGPKRLPELARTMGKGFGQLRRAMFDIKAEVEREIGEETGQIKHDLPDWKQEYPLNQSISEDEAEGTEGVDRNEFESGTVTESISSTATELDDVSDRGEQSPTSTPEDPKEG